MLCKRSQIPVAVTLFCVLSGCATPTNGPDPYLVREYTAWGDSLTAGCEDGTQPYCSYPYQLGEMGLDRIVNNYGIGGQTSGQIAARMGAVATHVTDSFTIPASGSVSNVTFLTGYEPCYNWGPGNTSLVQGMIDRVTVNCADSGDHVHFTLYRVTAGSSQAVNSGDVWTPVLPPGTLQGLNIIWAGGNNSIVCNTVPGNPSNCQVDSDIAAMTAYVVSHGGHYLVMPILKWESAVCPSTACNVWYAAINDWIAATYPNNYYDINAALVAAYNPNNPVDVIDHANDDPPFSLHAFDASGTLAAAVSSTTTCAITFGTNISGRVAVLGSEYIYVTGGSDGAYTCTRGYAGSTAATYASGQSWTSADFVHLSGDGSKNTNNPNGTGYTVVAKSIEKWIEQHQQ
ncbi:MAG TPA: SGNH/GDSL hydrolase family protein [Acidobacteriaceae bacterium]|nr:SGNH/GDSL hydrolase family protein [Acidobacteriaceae bacterium]